MKWSFSSSLIVLLFLSSFTYADFTEEGPYLENIPEPRLEASLEESFFVMDGAASLEGGLGEVPNIMPVDGRITSRYGWRRLRRRRGRMHLGVDIAAPTGTPILASAPGKVYFTGRKGGYGKTIILDHGNNVHTLYAHSSKIFVKEGSYVRRGQKIAAVGSTGRSTGPHVHYEVRVKGKPMNPQEYF